MILIFPEGTALCPFTVTCICAFDVHMLCMTLIVRIVHTFHSFTVNTNSPAGMVEGTHICAFVPLGKAVAACVSTGVRVLSSHHDISFAAAIVLIIAAVLHTTF
jgi:hypothetical protein